MERKFKNKTKIIRTDHSRGNHYTCISNLLIKDDRLNVTEKGLMLMLLSNADEYILNTTYFRTQVGIGVVKFNECIRHLIELGYLIKKPIQGGVEWIINESPSFTKLESSPTGNNPTETSPTEINPTGNEPLINNNEIDKNEMRNNEENRNEINITGTSILGEEIFSISNQVEDFFNNSTSTSKSGTDLVDHSIIDITSNPDLNVAPSEPEMTDEEYVRNMPTRNLIRDMNYLFEPDDWYNILLKEGANKFVKEYASRFNYTNQEEKDYIELLIREFYKRENSNF